MEADAVELDFLGVVRFVQSILGSLAARSVQRKSQKYNENV
jgi:hypothetical protein